MRASDRPGVLRASAGMNGRGREAYRRRARPCALHPPLQDSALAEPSNPMSITSILCPPPIRKRLTEHGPRIGGSDILADFGINMQINAASGRPYTANLRPLRFGSTGAVGAINGNRLPWRFNVDLRADKTFNLSAAGKRDLNLNVYLRVSNLLDIRNVVGVYRYTGSPTDDGYLSIPEGQTSVDNVVSQGRSLQAYLDSYSWAMLNPNNYTQPRRIFVGAALLF